MFCRLLCSALLAATMTCAAESNILTSGFDANTGAHVFTGNTDNSSGSTSLTITDWTTDATVTSISGLTAISTRSSGVTQGGFAQTVNGTAAYASPNVLYLSANHNLDGVPGSANSKRGYRFSFTLGGAWNLAKLNVISGHTTNTGNADQTYTSNLFYSLSGGTLGIPVTASQNVDYATNPDYRSIDFDLTATTLGAGTYTIEVWQSGLNTGGAYATFNGITLTGENGNPPPPIIHSFAANKTYVPAGGTVALSWQTSGADTLSISPNIGDVTTLSPGGNGSTQVTINRPITHTLTATNTFGSTTRTVSVASGPPRPNLILIVADDYGPQDTSVAFCLDSNGNPVNYNFNQFYQTPNLDALAASGMRFTSAYAQSVCSPTRCGLMTGRNSARHAVSDWVGGGGAGSPSNWRSAGINGSDVTLPKLLQGAGYRTIHVGKAHFSNSSVPVSALGFDVNVAGGQWGHPPQGYIGTAGYGGLPGLEAYDGSMYLTQALAIEANKALENAVAEGRPFFLHMAFYATHAPFTTNPNATGNYSTAVNTTHRAFATMAEGMDLAIGSIRQKLAALGVADDTLIVFLGDNGSDSPATTQDGFASGAFSDFPMRGKKGSKWEGGSRIPLIVSWAVPDAGNPWQQNLPISANRIETDIVTSWDLPVTLLHIAGAQGTAGFGEDGHNLSPYLAGTPGSHRPQELVMHYPHVHRSNYFSWIRQGNMKLIYNFQDNSHQLYDLAADPTESLNLASTRPEILTRMARALAQKLQATWGTPGPLLPTVSSTAPAGNVVSIPNNAAVDVDHDGIPDTIEDPGLNGIVNPGETNPDEEDSDDDGTGDGAEQRTGTDPLNGSSFFRVVPAMESGTLVLRWPSAPGALYRIEVNTSLENENWEALADPVSASSGTETAFPVGAPAAIPRRFFRIVLK